MKPKQFKELLTVKLREDEIKKYSLQLAKTCGEKKAKEEEKAKMAERINSELKLMRQSIDELSGKVETGEEDRLVECEERPMYDLGVIWVVRLDTFEKIRERPMTGDDRQARMFEDETAGLRNEFLEDRDAAAEDERERVHNEAVAGWRRERPASAGEDLATPTPLVVAPADEFTAVRCATCGRIDGGHALDCANNPDRLTHEDYVAYSKAHYKNNHQSHARKMELTKLMDDQVREWKAEQQQPADGHEPETKQTKPKRAKLSPVEAAIDR